MDPDDVARQEFKRLLEADVEKTLDSMRDRKSRKVILNSDDLFRIYPTYAIQLDQRFRLGPILYPVARKFTDATFERLLKNAVTEKLTRSFLRLVDRPPEKVQFFVKRARRTA